MSGRTVAVWSERGAGDGWWATLAHGWCSSDNPGQHALHAPTKAALMREVRASVPCRCEDCRHA